MSLKILIVISGIFLMSCQTSQSKKEITAIDIASVPLIPKPVSITPGQGSFTLNEKTAIYIDKSSTGIESITGYLAQKLFPATGIQLNIAPEKGVNQIALLLS